MIFGLKVKKKKKKKQINTDLVLANKGAVGEAWKINTATHTHNLTLLVVCIVYNRAIFSCHIRVANTSPCQTVTSSILVYTGIVFVGNLGFYGQHRTLSILCPVGHMIDGQFLLWPEMFLHL